MTLTAVAFLTVFARAFPTKVTCLLSAALNFALLTRKKNLTTPVRSLHLEKAEGKRLRVSSALTLIHTTAIFRLSLGPLIDRQIPSSTIIPLTTVSV
jgi:heme/copper-type cytochrome/quinol oxidase subunit 4